ncbi:heptaprenyl diphosphate synthase component I [Enterococcus sp. AZ191]
MITIVAIFTMNKRDSFLLLWLRLFLTTLLGGTISTFLYSMSGALLSYLGMLLVKKLGPKRVSIIGISATGGFMHNVGQLVTASFIAQSWTVMLYLPILSFLGILSGIAIGIAANYLLRHVRTLQKFQKEYELKKKDKWQSVFLEK